MDVVQRYVRRKPKTRALRLWRRMIKFLWKLWASLLVILGFRVWARLCLNRPKRALCVFHSIYMKRVAKTKDGAVYYCKKCKRTYKLEGGRNMVVPIGRRK